MDEENELSRELAADFLSDDDAGSEEPEQELSEEPDNRLDGEGEGEGEGDDDAVLEKRNGYAPKSHSALASELEPVIKQIEDFTALTPEQQARNRLGRMEESPEYKTMTDASRLSTLIDSDIITLHKYIRDRYSQVLMSLERLVENPIQYAKTVAIIGNEPQNLKDLASSSENIVGQSLDQILDKPTLMGVRMDASTIKDVKPLPEAEFAKVLSSCQLVISYDRAKKVLRDYVESRMNYFAPNLTVLIGAEVAAQLVNAAGGVAKLAVIPACNLAAIGSGGGRGAGLATNVGGARNKGAIYHSSLVMNVPRDERPQAVRIVANKLSLACRADATLKTHDDTIGRQLREQLGVRLEKISTDAPAMQTRALRAPDDKPSTKRGGRAARQKKMREQQTELQRQANRMGFNSVESEAGLTGEGMGSIGQGAGQGIRVTQINKKTEARLSKKNQKLLGSVGGGSGLASSFRGFGQGSGTATGIRTSGVGTSLNGAKSGLESTVKFGSGGLELVDPRNRDEMERKRKLEEDRYFKSGTFTSVGGGSASVLPQEPKVDSGGFKVPALPAIKRAKKAV